MSIQGLLSLHNTQSRNQFSEKMNVVVSLILQQHLLPIAGHKWERTVVGLEGAGLHGKDAKSCRPQLRN